MFCNPKSKSVAEHGSSGTSTGTGTGTGTTTGGGAVQSWYIFANDIIISISASVAICAEHC